MTRRDAVRPRQARSHSRVRETSDPAGGVEDPGTRVLHEARVAEEAAAAAHQAAAVAQSAATAAGTAVAAGANDPAADSAIVQHAAAVVEGAAAIVEEAAQVLQESAAAAAEISWPTLDRRRRPRRSHLKEVRTELKHLAVYFPLLLIVATVGGFAIWSFLERQSLVTTPVPLPAVTILTAHPESPLAAAWVRLLSEAELSVTVVPIDRFEPITKGVVVICDAPELPPVVARGVSAFHAAGGPVVIAGAAPGTPLPGFPAGSGTGLSDGQIKLSENASPILARTNPGAVVSTRPTSVAYINESSRMVIDARWSRSARAAIAHIDSGRSRLLWFGFDPEALGGDDRQLLLVVRTAFRWLDGQPVSEGAVGEAALSNPLTPAARRAARGASFAFSVDALRGGRSFRITFANRGDRAIPSPTMKIWLPPGAPAVALGGDLFMRRNAVVTSVPDEHACLVSLPALARHEERVLKLRIVEAAEAR